MKKHTAVKKTSIENDAPKRKAMLRFCEAELENAEDVDGRFILALLTAWEKGYEAARKRFAKSRSRR